MSQFFLTTPSGGGGGGIIDTIAGDTGSITGANVTIFANNAANNSGSSVSFVNSGTISTLNLTDAEANTFLGKGAGNVSVVGADNVALGDSALKSIGISAGNTALGTVALELLVNSTGDNTAGGFASLGSITTGAFNTAYGAGSGGNYTSSESSNITIGWHVLGTLGESHVLRIGTNGSLSGQQNKAFISGISGVTVPNSQLVTIDANSQLGNTPFSSFIQNITSPTINFKNTGVTSIFTTTGNFLVTNLIYYPSIITGTTSGIVADFGWTAPNFNDFTSNSGALSFEVNSPGPIQYQISSAITNAALPIIPSGQVFSVNITTADTATTTSGVIIVQGMYV